jgi:hypothetical protein
MVRRLRLLERLGRMLGFSPEGRRVRLWTQGRPGEEDSTVVEGTVVQVVRDAPGVTGASAVVQLAEPVRVDDHEHRWVLAVPAERGFALEALWFSFIAVDALPLEHDGSPPAARWPERIGRWWMRLGRRGG